MTTYPYDIAVLIGRFQPFHRAHAALLAQALATAPMVVIALGSSLQARDAKDPFTWEERAAMIGATLPESERARLRFVPIRDYYDDQRWAAAVRKAVEANAESRAKIALIGHFKDASSYYLSRFPHWELIAADAQGEIDATAIRAIYFESEHADAMAALLQPLLPAAVWHYLKGWRNLPAYGRLREEHLAIVESRRVWGSGPFITVDAVLRALDHVLLIQRGRAPGKGSWALPGGFLDGRERVLQGAIRELREETGFAMLDSELEAALSDVAVFDHPDRSQRGRTITHAHFFELNVSRLPEVKGADDAALARWFPVDQLLSMEDQLFEDHFHILNHFLELVK